MIGLALVLFAAVAAAVSPETLARIERIFAEAYPPDGPGAAVLIVQDGKPLLRKGYGLASLELGVPITPDMVFRVGSVTKQFTAACVLKLVEQGRLALSDDISKHLPDFPMQGRRVSVEQLLTHTSGIRSYTDMPAWFPRMREDWTLPQTIGFFQNEPFDFEPGTKWHYDNSGYILLGAILEKVTGKKYEDLVCEWIFQPLGMNDTRYGNDEPILPRRVAGYEKTPGGLVNAPFLSMTQPFSAGGLVSTVDDLARWQAALDAGAVLSPGSLRRWWTPVTLPDGTKTRYGFGWGIGSYEGHPVVQHGGAINGFETANIRLPEDHLYVAVLSNCGGCADPDTLGFSAAAIVIAKPLDARRTVLISPALLDAYAGAYTDSHGDDWVIRRKEDHLEVQAGSHVWDAYATSETGFLLQRSVWTLRFVRDAGGAIATMEIDEGMGPVERAGRKAP